MTFLQQQLANRLEGRIRQQQLEASAAIVHVDAEPRHHGGVGRPGDRGKTRVVEALELEETLSTAARRPEIMSASTTETRRSHEIALDLVV